MNYYEKLVPILQDLENKEIELAGGSVVGMVLSITNSLMNYICNLTIGKKKYSEVQDEVLEIQKQVEILRNDLLKVIDQDKEVLEKILSGYKQRKENPDNFEKIEKEAVQFCAMVTRKAVETLKLVTRIEKVGNQMLASDFKISRIYAFASVEASIVNIEVNLNSVADEKFKEEIKSKYEKDYEEAKKIMERPNLS